MKSNSRKLMACFVCGYEEEVAEEAQTLLCSHCVIKGRSLPSKEERKEKRKLERAAERADKELASFDKPKKKRGRPKKNPEATDEQPKRKRGRSRKNPV